MRLIRKCLFFASVLRYSSAMDIRALTDRYYVAPQIEPGDFTELAEMGFSHVICNRPDAEVPPSHAAKVMAKAAAAAGVGFTELPITHGAMTPDTVTAQTTAIAAGGESGKVLAYCASGTRSTIMWALGQAPHQSVDAILAASQAGGYDLQGLRPTLENIAANAQSAS